MERHVLAVYPHPDDETFGKGGTLALYAKQGVPVTVVCGTLGQLGRNMGKPFFATRESLPFIREKELRNACEALGVKDLRLLGLRDKTVEFEDPDVVADMILDVIRDVNPSVIITYYPGYGVHPDHDALAWATVRAVKKLPKEERPVLYCSPITDNVNEVFGKPDVVFDVSEVLDAKLEAMRAHASQSQAMMARWQKEASENEETRVRMEQFLKTERYWIYKIED